ncbi:hypothetical protein ACJJTC_015430 [Scirpophaga incertulas]
MLILRLYSCLSGGLYHGAERARRRHSKREVLRHEASSLADEHPEEAEAAFLRAGAPEDAVRLWLGRGQPQRALALAERHAEHMVSTVMELSELGGGISKREVLRHEASSLADEHPEEAEAAFLRAGAPEDAVRLWLGRGQPQRALALAERHAEHMVDEVLVDGARAAAERGDLAQFETLMIRANRPREVVQHYKELELWEEAARVSREYLPEGGEPVPAAVPPLLQRAAQHADRGEWWEAVELLLNASAAGASGGATKLAERAALRAARLARDHLHGGRRRAAADMLYERFAAIDQSDIGDQLRAALIDGYGDDDTTGVQTASAQFDEGITPVVSQPRETELDSETEALERLARAGHWQRCLAHAGSRAPHYALRYTIHLFKTHPRMDGVDITSESIPEALSQVLDTLRQYVGGSEGAAASVASADAPLARAVCAELLTRVSMAPRALEALKDAAAVMHAIGADDRAMQAITLLAALHVPQVAGKAARALPRYTDLLVADVVYYSSGTCVRGEGSGGAREAFVLLNRCLDLAEAADDDSAHLLDYTDFECTDWSRTPLLLESSCVRGPPLDNVREWVLTVSMDQAVEQTLPLDNRGLYSSCVSAEEQCCVITGFPLGSRLVTFTNGRCANRESWSRVASASRSGPGSAAAALLGVVGRWCGPADYAHV